MSRTVELDFGAGPHASGVFDLRDDSVTVGQPLRACTSGLAASVMHPDELEMDPILWTAIAGNRTVRLLAQPLAGPVGGRVRVTYGAF